MADLPLFNKYAAHERILLARLYVAAREDLWDVNVQRNILREMLPAAREAQVDISFEDSDIGRCLIGLDENALSDEEYDSILSARTVHDYITELVNEVRVCLNRSTSRRYLRKLCENVSDTLDVTEIEKVDLEKPYTISL